MPRAAAVGLLLLAATAAVGWHHLPPALLLLALLWLPGRVFGCMLGGAVVEGWGTGRLAIDATLSLAVLSFTLLPLYVVGAPVAAAPIMLGIVFAALSVLVLRQERARRFHTPPGHAASWKALLTEPRLADPLAASSWERAAFALAIAVLLPVVLEHSGGNVDDWWDLAFVRSWIERGHFHFEEPVLGSGRSHPRFLWSVWLALQAVVASCTTADAWRVQAGPLAGAVAVIVVSSYAALARTLFGVRDRAAALTIVMVAAWLWGSESIPFFTRIYQDKHVAGFALAPVLIALVLRALPRSGREARRESEAAASRGAKDAQDGGSVTRDAELACPLSRSPLLAVACASIAIVSVHSLVYTMAVFAAVVAAVAWQGPRSLMTWLRTRRGLGAACALLAPAIYPLGQALRLAIAFGDQGIGLSAPDNPVVRAHLALERLLFTDTAFWIVHPGAVFGAIAVPALVGVAIAVRRRREPAARVLLALTLVPGVLLFVPLLAGIAGALWVPWMLYRLGWLIPVPLLLAYGIATLWRRGRVGSGPEFPPLEKAWFQGLTPARMVAAVITVLVVDLATTAASDRLRRDMAEHPEPGAPFPRGNVLGVYRFLADEPGGGRVLAMAGLAELLPAMTGKPVVASTERQTLVFSLEETRAYARLRNRSEFFAAGVSADRRHELSRMEDARWAVLPRRLVLHGSERRWLRRFGAEAYHAARRADQSQPWWSSTREGARQGLGTHWSIVFENEDFFVAHRSEHKKDQLASPANALIAAGAHVPASSDGDASGQTDARDIERRDDSDVESASAEWLSVLDAQPSVSVPLFEDPLPRTRGVLASVSGYPGGIAASSPPPQLLTPSQQPMWIGGAESWEDIPAQATIKLALESRCRIDAVRILPYQPRLRREALEIQVDGKTLRRQALHDAPIDIPLSNPDVARPGITVVIRSLLGNPLSLSDVALMGDPDSCDRPWKAHHKPLPMAEEPTTSDLLSLAAAVRDSGRPMVSLARKATAAGRREAALSLLVEATHRDPSLTAAWIDLGFNLDDRDQPEAALAAFRNAVASDSRSAWAQGCLAWAQIRRGAVASALWHALRARSLDPFYADSWTLVAYVAHAIGAHAWAEHALDAARRTDRERDWPYLARSEFAAARGDIEGARAVLLEYLAHMPMDAEVRKRLVELGGEVPAAANGHDGDAL